MKVIWGQDSFPAWGNFMGGRGAPSSLSPEPPGFMVPRNTFYEIRAQSA